MKKKSNFKSLLYTLLYLLMVCLYSEVLAQPDTAGVGKAVPVWQERHFSEEKLRELQEDDKLSYQLAAGEEDNWWSNARRWFILKLAEFFGGASRSGLLDIIIYAICIGAGIFMIVRFLDIDISTLVHRRAPAASIGVREGITENIHELDFEREVQTAVQQHEYRRAVRLLYLASLKRLSDADLIRFEPGKTNHQYQRELRKPACSSYFASLGYFFEYAWYGDFPVDEQLFQQVEQVYQQLCKQVEVPA